MKNEMSQAAKDARNAYSRKWKKNNADKVRKYHANYWERIGREIDIKLGYITADGKPIKP